MIVAILLAFLDRIGQRRHFRDVFFGVGLALVLAGGAGVAAYLTIRTYAGSRTQTIFETATYFLAAVVLTYMTLWMHAHARTIARELRERTERALQRGERFGLGFLAFQAVGREGLETVVFTLAIVLAAGPGVHYALIGAPIGLLASLCVAFSIYRLGRRINIGRFFIVLGVVLMFFAAGLLADCVENLNQLGWLTALGHPLWNTSRILSEDSALGDIFHSLFGYADRPSVLQAVVYVVSLLAGFGTMWVLARGRRHLQLREAAAGHPAATEPRPAPAEPLSAPDEPLPAPDEPRPAPTGSSPSPRGAGPR